MSDKLTLAIYKTSFWITLAIIERSHIALTTSNQRDLFFTFLAFAHELCPESPSMLQYSLSFPTAVQLHKRPFIAFLDCIIQKAFFRAFTYQKCVIVLDSGLCYSIQSRTFNGLYNNGKQRFLSSIHNKHLPLTNPPIYSSTNIPPYHP